MIDENTPEEYIHANDHSVEEDVQNDVDEEYEEDGEGEEEEEYVEGEENIKKPEKPYDPSRQLKNLTTISHESNDSMRRNRRRAKVTKIKTRTVQRKRKPEKDAYTPDYTNEYDVRSELEEYTGYIQILEGHFALMRSEKVSFIAQEGDIVIPKEMVQRYSLRSGHKIHGVVRTKRNRRQKVVTEILDIQDEPIQTWRSAPTFQSLTSVNPFEFFRLSTPADNDKSMSLMELLTPIGRGQRGLLVAPPRTGKTMLMEKIANGIASNHPETEILLLLIDERPEEVTHLTRKVKGKVFASCLDKPIEEHIALCQMVIDLAHRKVERGKDVVILLDSITRMARAYNNQLKSSGRTLSGGVDAKALMEPKKFFGSARKLEEGGSLTIIATALVQTGSQMDEVIFQEFKGTGNMELVLNRRLAEKRIYPAIDIPMSGTRREELILPPEYFKAASKFRRYLSNMTDTNQMPAAIQALEKYKTTAEFVKAFA